ncbi:hypothetical protein PVK06_026249 [Gossypium arboreum]|uniref:Reverse transcriptase n=1 Tax=Gossypium arboreum TaxID=29729 RepID=A0ABR0NX58_GOSAR|nr:hypothetical protein PVK06_026249 [Gossypium arboreum]
MKTVRDSWDLPVRGNTMYCSFVKLKRLKHETRSTGSKAYSNIGAVLIPKGQKPTHIADLRLISCSSVIYKCVTKILVRRFILAAIELPQQSIQRIKACKTTTRFSIALNGGLVGYFKGTRGITQGSQSPMKYLVSFLVTRRVSVKDCLPLLERISPKMTT